MADTDIVALAEAKKQLNIAADDTSQDDELQLYIEAVTEVVEQVVGPVAPRTVTEVHDGRTGPLVLRRPPVLSVTSVTEAGIVLTDGWSTAGGLLYRLGGRWAGGQGGVTVIYQAGRASTAAAIKLAAKELVMVNYRPQLGGDYSPFDTDSPDEGVPGEVRLGFFVPNRVRDLLAPHDQYAGIG
ncbi:head-tail connector protein [Micromonospora endolithica]|uniref:Phage gp6-like head-tail connector protein n=1 Tax=Micromonospora endolithica TaxID=230091 RepID=A0A3A9YR81_9ACTN|nr:head-tail connector protein [Micromonospora endolithica]RKN38455.1 phage gp6-like head-tail connector protein [Micromonospora endolithica]TWJ23125.1 hypothetical protein JD76_03254 [Micromonospora endolithica]